MAEQILPGVTLLRGPTETPGGEEILPGVRVLGRSTAAPVQEVPGAMVGPSQPPPSPMQVVRGAMERDFPEFGPAGEEPGATSGMVTPEGVGQIIGGYGGASLATGISGGFASAGLGPLGMAATLGITAAGTGIGSGVGKGLELLGEWWQRKPEDRQMTAGEVINTLGKSALEGAALEGLTGPPGHLFSKGVQKILSPNLVSVDKAHQMANAAAEKWGVEQITAQKTGNAGLQQLSAYPGRFPWGVQRVAEFAQKQVDQLEGAVQKLITKIDPRYSKAREAVGRAIMSDKAGSGGAEALLDKAQGEAKVLYDAFEPLLEQGKFTPFSTPKFLERNRELFESEKKLRGTLQNPAFPALQSTEKNIAGDKTITGQILDPLQVPAALMEEFGLNEKTVELPFYQIREIRSRLGALMTNEKNPQVRRTYALLHNSLMEDMDEIAKKTPGLGDAMSLANDFYRRQVANKFLKNETFVMARQQDASDLVQVLLPPGVSPEQVRRIKKMVSPEVFQRLQAGFLADITGRRAIGKVEEISPEAFLRVTGPKSYSDQSLRALLGKAQYANLQEVRSVFRQVVTSRLGGANPPETARAVMGGQQLTTLALLGIGGALQLGSFGWLNMLSVPALVMGAAVGFGPSTLAKLLYSDGGRQYLEKGTPLGQLLRRSPAAMTRLARGSQIPFMLAGAQADWPWDENGEDKITPQAGVPIEGGGMQPGSLTPGMPPQGNVPVVVPPSPPSPVSIPRILRNPNRPM